METALRHAAADHGVTLTSHDVVIQRAQDAVQRLDAFMHSLKGTGRLQEFNRAYRAHREAAAARGHGFMSYGQAEARLRRALVPYLVGGQAVPGSLFAEVFR